MTSESASQAADTPQINHSYLTNLRRLSFIEGVSTLVLFGIAMPLKYVAGMPTAVRIVGSLHGFLFVGLALMLMMAITQIPIRKTVAFVGIFAAIVPFGPFVYDRWLMTKLPKPESAA